jgi:hypothetical protein
MSEGVRSLLSKFTTDGSHSRQDTRADTETGASGDQPRQARRAEEDGLQTRRNDSWSEL